MHRLRLVAGRLRETETMNGPEHYREAERLAELATEAPTAERAMYLAAKAQVHASLALAAATAYPAVKDYTGDEDGSVSRGWAGVA
jgi:hypothetical protein